jgi:hypothetical protein
MALGMQLAACAFFATAAVQSRIDALAATIPIEKMGGERGGYSRREQASENDAIVAGARAHREEGSA